MIRIPYIKGLLHGCSNGSSRGKSHFVSSRYGDTPIASFTSFLIQSVPSHRPYSASTHRPRNGIPSWATFDPKLLGTMETPYAVQNIVNGVWQVPNTSHTKSGSSDDTIPIPHPFNTDVTYPIFTVPNTTNIQPFVDSLRSCPKTGLHNPYKNVERYVQYGDISRKVTHLVLYCF
jgi:hypothetical protein